MNAKKDYTRVDTLGTGREQERSTTRLVLAKRLVALADLSSWIGEALVDSPDSRRIAYVDRVGNNFLVVVDGKAGKAVRRH